MIAYQLAQQVVVIFLLVGLGVFIQKKGVVTMEAARQFSDFSLMFIAPILMVKSFQREYDHQLLLAVGAMAVLATLFHVVSAVLVCKVFGPREDGRESVERLGCICTNCGFMGIPLLTTTMGEVGALYAVVYIVALNVYTWSHGLMVVRRTREFSVREILTSPGVLGAALGLSLFLLRIRLPLVIADAVSFVASMNTPLPMILIGVFIADVSVKSALTNLRIYAVSLFRLVALPLVFLGLCWALRVSQWYPGARDAVFAAMICGACPAAISTMMFPAKFGGDTEYAATIITVSTLLSVVTIPAIALLTQIVL